MWTPLGWAVAQFRHRATISVLLISANLSPVEELFLTQGLRYSWTSVNILGIVDMVENRREQNCLGLFVRGKMLTSTEMS